ncbi:MAG: hypothetical protein HPY67_01880 [Syntrophaceae bacterium]|nr:hypothetical protein [Syntrophaceae bacterium]
MLFDNEWIKKARNYEDQRSWVHCVLATWNEGGVNYLDNLRKLFCSYPDVSNVKKDLADRIQSFRNEDHLGAVNELSCWAFLRQAGFECKPIPRSDEKTPDFHVFAPTEFFVEVTTLNISKEEWEKITCGDPVRLNQDNTLTRILRKLKEKRKQFIYVVTKHVPCALVLFDYTFWSGFGTELNHYIEKYLLERQGFYCLPAELSALIYLKRSVIEKGRLAIHLPGSAIYYNPNASAPLPLETFAFLGQFTCELVEPKTSTSTDEWVKL